MGHTTTMPDSILSVRRVDALRGEIKASPSKSYTHRAVVVGSMNGATKIRNALLCHDTEQTIAMWRLLGAKISATNKQRSTCDLEVHGFSGSPSIDQHAEFDVRESGTLLRFLLPILSLCEGRIRVVGQSTITDRPNREIVEVLQAWGLDIRGRDAEHRVPIELNATGRLSGGEASLNGSRSSQVVSSLLIAAPFARQNTTLRIDSELVSRPYIEITKDVLKWAGIHIEHVSDKEFHVEAGQTPNCKDAFVVHGDYSSSAFIMAAAALVPSDVVITDLVKDAQGDREIVSILSSMGVDIAHDTDAGIVRVCGAARLEPIEINGRDIPDLIPIVTTLACFAKGTTRISNVAHLKGKESDRIKSPASELIKLGATIETTSDSITIHGGCPLRSGLVSSCRDHRVAMSMAVAGLAIDGGVRIEGSDCIAKSYPRFEQDMNILTGDSLSTEAPSPDPPELAPV